MSGSYIILKITFYYTHKLHSIVNSIKSLIILYNIDAILISSYSIYKCFNLWNVWLSGFKIFLSSFSQLCVICDTSLGDQYISIYD